MNIQPKESSGAAGETRESLVTRIAQDMIDKLPLDYVPHEESLSFSFIYDNEFFSFKIYFQKKGAKSFV